jgi:hypothetical protein
MLACLLVGAQHLFFFTGVGGSCDPTTAANHTQTLTLRLSPLADVGIHLQVVLHITHQVQTVSTYP